MGDEGRSLFGGEIGARFLCVMRGNRCLMWIN